MFHLKTLTLLVLLLAGTAGAQCVVTADGFGTRSYVLYAGQNIDAGSVTVQVTAQNLVITYQTTGLWKLGSAALWVGTSSTGYPQTKNGNPVPGKFPYKSGTLTNATSYQFMISLATLGFTCPRENEMYFLMAHADLYRTNYDGSISHETGWSDGDRVVERGNWATMSSFELTCDCDDGGGGGEKTCETAFAYDPENNACFRNFPEVLDNPNRWGWTNGPYNLYGITEPISLQFWAAAAQCDLTKGSLAGTVTLSYASGVATVIYNTTSTGWIIRETHTYLGNGRFPLDNNEDSTVAPGQFPYKSEGLNDVTRDTVRIELGTIYGYYYLIAHGVVCK